MTCLLKLNCNYAIGYVMLFMYYLAAVESKSICLLAMNINMYAEWKKRLKLRRPCKRIQVERGTHKIDSKHFLVDNKNERRLEKNKNI